MTYRWQGTLQRGASPDTIVGTLRDAFGFEINITGIKTAGGYEITGIPGPNPPSLALPGDEEDMR